MIVASIPFSTDWQVSNQSSTESFVSPLENDDLCRAISLSLEIVVLIISLIASVDSKRAKPLFAASFTETVDFPVPVAPAITTKRGGRLAIVFAVVDARPILRAM